MTPKAMTSPDQDIHKGAMEDERSDDAPDRTALDDDGLPNDEIAIAEDAVGARADKTQG